MKILAIDPGPETCGVVLYDAAAQKVLEFDKACPVEDALQRIRRAAALNELIDRVACERVSSTGIGSATLYQTAEVFGQFKERARRHGFRFVGLYRRDVLRELDLLGARGNRDSAVRLRMIEMHGGTKAKAIGLKKSPGPLHGISSHSWQALGLAVAVASREGLL